MSHPLCWPLTLSSFSPSPFHPLGQSPAISLTQDLTPEQPANILSLQCNDVYNILFTLFMDVYVGPGPRKMDITCSDIEPAILARNILVFTLICDDKSVDQIWNLYYDFKIDQATSQLLTTQSRALADASKSFETWTQSPYQAFIKILDSNTLAELHRHWTLYADFDFLPSSRRTKLDSEQKDWSNTLVRKLGANCNAAISRSTSLIWAHAAVPVSNQFKRYLRSGTTSHQVDDLSLNPTWVYASFGEKFDPSANSFPQVFHLVTAFLPDLMAPPRNIDSPLDKAKEQFKSGCEAFKRSLDAGAITLRFYTGDALQFCYALQSRGADPNQTFTSPWSARTIDLSDYFAATPPPPHTFDVIGSARLGDTSALGLINILLATHPLRSTPQSVIYTEVHSISEEAAIQLFIERISTDVPAFSTFMGLVPRQYASAFQSQSVAHELVIFDASEHYQRSTWVDISSGDPHPPSDAPIQFSVKELADALFSLYRHMHFYDNTPEFYAPASLPQMRTWSELNVTRETVALIFRHIQTRTRVQVKDGTWDAVANTFLNLVKTDTITYDGPRHWEDMKLQLGMLGFGQLSSPSPGGIFKEWRNVPPVVCVVLSIPSSASELNVLREYDEMVAPRLSCCIRDKPNGKAQFFSSLHAAWGTLVSTPNDAYTIKEDSSGNSDLIVSFWAPASLLTSKDAKVSLVFRYVPLSYKLYRSKLGDDMEIWKAGVNSERVKVLRERPMGSGTQRVPTVPSPPSPPPTGDLSFEVQGYWKNDRWYIKTITGRLDITSEEEKAVLQGGGKVTMEHLGPCTGCLKVDDYAHTVVFGYPVRDKAVKVRIARKSGYIEMVAEPYHPLDGGFPHTHIPTLATPTPTPWNMHHIPINRLPILDLSDTEASWMEHIVPHMSLQHSDHERIVMSEHDTSDQVVPRDKLHALKMGINTIVHDFTGFEFRGGPFEVFALHVPGAGVQAVILVAQMRVDLAGMTIVLDAAVVPITKDNKATVLPLLDPIGKAGVMIMNVEVKCGEMGVWKEYLTTCAERCRTWSHKPECEYTATGKIPLSTADGEPWLCSCGQNQGLMRGEWMLAHWVQLFPHATRVALSPIFSVQYLELTAGMEFKLGGYGRPPPTTTTPLNGCWACAKMGVPLSACGRCKRARYCSMECQKGHWKDHKKRCQNL